jgi:hypothetical protein
MAKQALAQRGLKDGVRAFFLDMQQQGKSAAESIYQALHSGLDRVSDEFANFLTGQKTNFGKMFQDIGHQLLADAIKSELQKGLASLGKVLGISGLGKPAQLGDAPTNPIYAWVVNGTASGIGQAAGGSSKGIGTIFGGSAGGGIFNLLGALVAPLFGGKGGTPNVTSSVSYPRAAGGSVMPGQSYLVGERGPEQFRPTVPGTIVANKDLGGGGATYYVSVDARGADENRVYERVAQAMEVTHRSAVGTSVQVFRDSDRRTPVRA